MIAAWSALITTVAYYLKNKNNSNNKNTGSKKQSLYLVASWLYATYVNILANQSQIPK